MRMALLAIPSKRAAPSVFMVSTVASKPSLPWTYSPCARAKVVDVSRHDLVADQVANSGTEIWREALSS